MIFQMMFAIITPALITGAFAERMKFSAMVLFSILWGTLVYCPLCHWVWGGGILMYGSPNAAMCKGGALDFAGGDRRAYQFRSLGLGVRFAFGKTIGLWQRANAAT